MEPQPTHWIDLPSGYLGSRAVALKLTQGGDRASRVRYVAAPEPARTLPPAVTAEEAIGDLPELRAREMLAAGTLRRGARRFDVAIPWGGQTARASMFGGCGAGGGTRAGPR